MIRLAQRVGRCLPATLLAFALAGCGGGAGSSPGTTPSGTGNRMPQIAGTPPASVTAGTFYSFQPSAADADRNSLTFSVTNNPAWTTFSTMTGQLSGTPAAADVGTYNNIVIRVNDGLVSTALPAFSITVAQIGTGVATLSWVPPTQNNDGTPLLNLAGYHIYYGTSTAALSRRVDVASVGITSYMVQDLGPATWYFTVRAYNRAGGESDPSSVASKTIQ